MKKYLIIINPVAGTGDIKYSIDTIKKRFDESDLDFDIVFSNKAGNVTELAKNASDLGYTDIIAVGGDGTILEAFNGIIGSDLRLGIIPAGTGNDFAKSLNISIDVNKAIEVIFNNKTKKIDYGKINDIFFLNVAGLGIDTEIVIEAGKIKNKIPGPMAYLMSTIKNLATYKCKKVRVIIDGREIEKEVLIVAVGNGKYFGGGMKITPEAIIDDGAFDVCIIEKMPKLKLARLFPSIFTGKHIQEQVVEYVRGKNIQIWTDEQMSVNADGNIIGVTPCHISVIKNGLSVYSNME